MPLDAPIIPNPEEMDAGRRVHEAVTLHLIADPYDAPNRWCAFRLDDGRELDAKATYDSKEEAIFRAMPNEEEYCYLQITPDGITPSDAVRFLRICRHPMIDNLSPVWVTNRAMFPRFSNLTRQQRNRLKAEAERQAKENG